MKTLNLITPSASDIPYKVFTFPDGQPHIIIEPLKKFEGTINIISRISNPADLLLLLCAANVLKRMGVMYLNLECTYLLGGRMDRVMSLGEPFTLEVVLSVISNTNTFDQISIFDPHSSTASYLSRPLLVVTKPAFPFIKEVIRDLRDKKDVKDITLVAPDEGAKLKVIELQRNFSLGYILCKKTRDVTTGALSNPVIDYPGSFLPNNNFLIVDDLCDGGYTFIQLAAAMREKGAKNLYLAVSHGIFSKGLIALAENYNHIYTTNSYKEQEESPKLTTIKLW